MTAPTTGRTRLAIASLLVSTLAGCSSSDVKPVYVSPLQYQALDCPQLHAEYHRVNRYIKDGVRSPEGPGVGVGLGVGGGYGGDGWGWGIGPNISFNMSQAKRAHDAELSRVLGEREAIAQAANYKGCPVAAARKKPCPQ